MSERQDNLLGNGTLTVASRLASVWGGALATIAAMLIWYFGARYMDKIDKMETAISGIQTTIAATGQHALDQDRRIDRVEGRLFK